MEDKITKEKLGLKPKEILWGSISLVIFIGIFLFVFKMYLSEGEKRKAEYSETPNSNDYLELNIKVIGVDPIKGDLNTRISIFPNGKYMNAKDFLTENVNFYINATTGKQEYNFQKGKIINPIEVTFGLYGQVNDYPLDIHEAQIVAVAEIPVKPTASHPQDSIKEDEIGELIPIKINFNAFLHGYKFDAGKDTTITEPYTAVNVEVSRAGSTKFFSYFIMVAMWLLSGIVVFLVLSVVVRGRKIELGKFAFMSAMIFALPALRNMQPLIPTIGTFSDYVSFFWAEALIALSLFTVVFTWLRRPPPK
jgi:hypothetical protein